MFLKQLNWKCQFVLPVVLCILSSAAMGANLLVEAECFAEKGGWALDQQFMDTMGSPYLLAHGLGEPVSDAVTTVTFPESGTYKVWVRTKNWVPGKWDAPGQFYVVIENSPLAATFGTIDGWTWQEGGTVTISKTKVEIRLIDLTGFDGRCDAIYFDTDQSASPLNFDVDKPEVNRQWRNKLRGLPATPLDGGYFDVVIVGGGISGCGAALAAEREGMKVALINDRMALGGNASSEIRVHTEGIHGKGQGILEQIDTVWYPNGSADSIKDDAKREKAMTAAKGIKMFRPFRAYDVQMKGSKIVSVDACSTVTGKAVRVRSDVFIDCTGDGWIGFWAGAEYRYGRESKDEFGEGWDAQGDLWSPKKPDNRVMGSSLLWYSTAMKSKSTFPEVPWAMDVAKGKIALAGEWYWEYSDNDKHQIDDAEEIRDHMLRAIYGSFYNAKKDKKNTNRKLDWVGYLNGKRESRRLIGDYIYKQSDALEGTLFNDAVAEEVREIDVHYQKSLKGSPYDFLSTALFRAVPRYYIPFRCLYSKNIDNLMMAGRCFSCSHVGLGGPRVMNTCGQMGIATGYAASLCKKYDTNPRGVYTNHITELKELVANTTQSVSETPSKAIGSNPADSTVLVESEIFSQLGGWVLDTQVMDQMGSPYLMAHGLGAVVDDATTNVRFPAKGEYRVWVRTRDWVGQWKKDGLSLAMKAEGFPGRFKLLVDGKAVGATFGTEKANWHWQDGGVVQIDKKDVMLSLHDLTGFNGRCDAIVFSTDHDLSLPDSLDAMSKFRRELLGYPESPRVAGEYDIVVVGGGMAGICTAVSAARGGCSVALIQNRPVLGGNNSSEVRVGLSGLVRQVPYPKLGNLVDEIGPVGHWNKWEADRQPDEPRSKYVHEVIGEHPEKLEHNAGPASNYEDQKKLNAVLAEKNISLFLNTHVNGVTKDGSRIASVVGQNTRTGERLKFKGRLFADCTGDGSVGFLAGADFRVGREAKSLTDEKLAPEKSDNLVMGTSVQWYSTIEKEASVFPECPWAVQFDEKSCTKTTRGDWDWETGAYYDQVTDFEHIRDYGLRVVFGNWAVLKNHERFKEEFAKRRLEWVAYIGGKRESRRLLGDVILCQHDIVDQKAFSDACVTTTWTIDLHYPKTPMCACDAFRSEARVLDITPYPIPFRCLYSRNIDNLMMAGRNISVTHIALGTVRVMRTTGMMGEVLGMAASVCKENSCDPREVYTDHWPEMQKLMKKGVPFSSFDEITGR